MRRINNEDFLKVYNWMRMYAPKEIRPFSTTLEEDDRTCSIFLPHINKMIKGYGDTELHCFEDIAKQAKPLIDNYLSSHPEFVYVDKYNSNDYEIILTDEANVVVHIKEEIYDKNFEKEKRLVGERENFIAEFCRVFDDKYVSNDGFFFQMISLDSFPQNLNEMEIMRYMQNTAVQMFGDNMRRVRVEIKDDYVLVFGSVLVDLNRDRSKQ